MPCRGSSNPARTPSMSFSAQPIRISCGDQGEAYRDSLTARARELGVEDHVVFFNQFVDQATLLDFISMCDVYVTPYLNEAQMTSGTLAYSFGLGKAVVSTPYWHAKELLGDGRGILVPFGDAKAIGSEISGLLTNDVRRHAMRKRAYAASRSMTWAQTAKRYARGFRNCARARPRRELAPPLNPIVLAGTAKPSFRRCGSVISSRSATARACSSTPSIRCRTAPMAIVSTTTPAPCCSQARLRIPAKRSFCPKRHRTLCGVHPARLESGYPPVPQFHELRPPMAGGVGLGGQSRQDALGVGRMRARRHRSVPPRMGRGAVQDRASGRRDVLVSARLGLLAPGVGRLLRAGRRRPLRQRHAQDIGRQVDGSVSRKPTQGLALVRRRSRLRQCAPFAGADPNGPGDRYAVATSRPASDRCAGSCRCRPRHPGASGRSAPKASAGFAAAPARVRSAAGRGGSSDFRLPRRVAGGRRRGVAGRGRCAHSPGFSAKTI